MIKLKQPLKTHWNGLSAQKRNRTILLSSLVCIVVGWVLLNPKKDNKPVQLNEKPTITLASDTVPIEDLWFYRSEQQLNENTRVLENLQTDFAQLKSKQTHESTQTNVDALQAQINLLKEAWEEQQLQQTQSPHPQYGAPDFEHPGQGSSSWLTEPRIIHQSFVLSQPHVQSKTPNDYIPIGSFAQAILLNGLDASTATTASSNPLPVLMRLTSDAILPRQFKGKMKTCHVIAGAYGELSTTRVMMRLETITCTDKAGNIFESIIEGYITGDDGRVGVLGTLRDDTNPLLAKSFAAGLLGGIGQGIADSTGTTSTSALGTVQTYDTDEIFKMGLGEGASTALDRLAQYYIDRAEQIYPVIQVAPGRKITLVISGSQGLTLSTSHLEEQNK